MPIEVTIGYVYAYPMKKDHEEGYEIRSFPAAMREILIHSQDQDIGCNICGSTSCDLGSVTKT